MQIVIKNSEEIYKIKKASKLAAEVLVYIKPFVKIGVSTEELNQLCHDFIIENDAIPAPLNYHGFPKSICTSINNVVCHGIPSEKEILKDWDILNIDITVIKDWYHWDTSKMFCVGNISQKAQMLVARTEKALKKGIEAVRPGMDFSIIGKTIEKYISKFNYGIVRDFTGHGIGTDFHEDPYILHYGCDHYNIRMEEWMIFTIEPMINASEKWQVETDEKDKWTVRTTDWALSAQFEHTVLVTKNWSKVLTII